MILDLEPSEVKTLIVILLSIFGALASWIAYSYLKKVKAEEKAKEAEEEQAPDTEKSPGSDQLTLDFEDKSIPTPEEIVSSPHVVKSSE